MAWGRLDDTIIDHPKFAALMMDDKLKPLERIAAVGLWTKANAYCNKHLTDGFIPRGIVPLLAGVQPGMAFRLAQALINARGRSEHGLWEIAGSDYLVHDWPDWNRLRSEVESIRTVKSASGRAGGLRSGEARRRANIQANDEAKSEAKTNSHPSPSQPKTSGSTLGEATPRAREATLPTPVGNLMAVASRDMTQSRVEMLDSSGKNGPIEAESRPRQPGNPEPLASADPSPGTVPRPAQPSAEEQKAALARSNGLTRGQLQEQVDEVRARQQGAA